MKRKFKYNMLAVDKMKTQGSIAELPKLSKTDGNRCLPSQESS